MGLSLLKSDSFTSSWGCCFGTLRVNPAPEKRSCKPLFRTETNVRATQTSPLVFWLNDKELRDGLEDLQ